MPRRTLRVMLIVGALVVSTAQISLAADSTNPDQDHATPGNQKTIDAGPRTRGVALSVDGSLRIEYAGNQAHLAAGSTVVLEADPDNSSTGISATDLTYAIPADWGSGKNVLPDGPSTITYTPGAAEADGGHTRTIAYRCKAGCIDTGPGNQQTLHTSTARIDLTYSLSTPGSTNTAPTISAAADDAVGNEGDTLTVTGEFADGDPLTVTADNVLGDFQDNGDGSWSWSLATDDDVAEQSITVTASDGELSAADTFLVRADNVDPTVTATADAVGACQVTIDVAFTDPGSADTHTVAVDWGDGTSDPVVDGTSGMDVVHTYTAAGSYTVDVTVEDDDGGVGTDSATFATRNIPSAVLQPINLDGRSTFKLGSTVPVKLTVTDCGGGVVTSLAPVVGLVKIDNTPEAAVNEVASTSTPTAGTTMRWSVDQYVYNLSTKNSQFTSGSALTAGEYRVTVSDPSFVGPVVARFGLRK